MKVPQPSCLGDETVILAPWFTGVVQLKTNIVERMERYLKCKIQINTLCCDVIYWAGMQRCAKEVLPCSFLFLSNDF